MLSVPMLRSQHFILTITVTKAASQFWQEILSEILTEAHLGYSRKFYIAQAKVSEMFQLASKHSLSISSVRCTEICLLPAQAQYSMSKPLATKIRMGKTFMWHFKGELGALQYKNTKVVPKEFRVKRGQKNSQGNCLQGKTDPAEMKNHHGSRSEWRRELLGWMTGCHSETLGFIF